MKTSLTGQQAEAAVAECLRLTGHKVVARNWRRPRCEIDIISRKGSVLYFTEVKYRSSPAQGAGLDYVTPAKLKQMTFAAEIWCQENNYTGDWRLQAAEVSGPEFENVEIIEAN